MSDKGRGCQANPEGHQPCRYYAKSSPTKDRLTEISATTAMAPPLTIITGATTRRLDHLQRVLN